MNPTTKAKAGEGGYTLTEMLIVIVLIGLIAAAVTPGLVGQMSRARAKAASLQIETVASALESFRDDVGRYPSEVEGLQALVVEPSGAEGWLGPYIRSDKTLSDPWNRPFAYGADIEGRTFEITSLGADGKAGGKGADSEIVVRSQP